jgi:putative membrane protein
MTDWHRPHPLTVVVMAVTFITGNIVPLLVLVIAGGGLGIEMMGAVFGFVTVGAGGLRWYLTSYAVTPQAVEYRTGVLNRQARSIPLDRIQQVTLAQPALPRVVGLAAVRVSEASADGDVEISYLRLDAATDLTARLRALAAARAAPEPEAGAAASSLPRPPPRPATRVYEMELGQLVRYRLAVVLPSVAVLVGVGAVAVVAVGLGRGAGPAVAVAGVTLAVVAGVTVLGVVGAILRLGGFVLDRSGPLLRMEAGLLSRREVEVRADRVQTLTVSSGPVARRWGLHEVEFSAATGAAAGGSPLVHLGPAVPVEQVPALIQGAVDLDPAFGVPLESVSRLTIRRVLIRSALGFLVVGVPTAVLVARLHPLASVLVVAAWWAVAVGYARVRYARLGWSIDGRRLVVRRGILRHHLTQLALTNVQGVTRSASWSQRRLGLSDVEVSTAGVGPAHHVRIPDLPVETAEWIARRAAAEAASSRWELRR